MVVVGFGRLARWSLVAGRWPADGRCASRLCRSPPPPLADSPCSPLACLHFHPDHVPYPYPPSPNPSRSQTQTPDPCSQFTFTSKCTPIHTHVQRAHSGNTSNRQTLPSPFPFPSPPSQPLTGLDWTWTWTGTCSIQSWTRDAISHRRHRAHSSIVFPATAKRAAAPARPRPRARGPHGYEPQPRPGRVWGPRRYHAPDHVPPNQTQTAAASFSPHSRYHGSLRSPPVHLDSYTNYLLHPASVTSLSTYF